MDGLKRVLNLRNALRIFILASVYLLVSFRDERGDPGHNHINDLFEGLGLLAIPMLGATWIASDLQSRDLNTNAQLGGSPRKILSLIAPAMAPLSILFFPWFVVSLFGSFPGSAVEGGDTVFSWGRWFTVPLSELAWLGKYLFIFALGTAVALMAKKPWDVVSICGTLSLCIGMYLLFLRAGINTFIDDLHNRDTYLRGVKCLWQGCLAGVAAFGVIYRLIRKKFFLMALLCSIPLYGAMRLFFDSGTYTESPWQQLFSWKVLYPFIFQRAIGYACINFGLLSIAILILFISLNDPNAQRAGGPDQLSIERRKG